MKRMSPRSRATLQRLKDDFPHYAERCLKIRPKEGGILPFLLNPTQQMIHRRIENQKARTGMVRVLILKPRQPGCSTYVEGRFYWLVTHRFGVRAYILTHEQPATDNLFEMAHRYHEHCPRVVQPHAGAASAKELFFDKLDSGYRVGTAGSKSTGRSSTVQYFHGSEVGFWPNARDHLAGVLQAVPRTTDTEVILESTGNGLGNVFHQKCMDAVKGRGDFELIFFPWFDVPEYQMAVPEDFELDEEETLIQETHGLSLEQMAWRRFKVIELGSLSLFKQEYPATVSEAFQASTSRVLINSEIVTAARLRTVSRPSGLIVAGIDPAGEGEDRSALVIRQGRKILHMETSDEKNTMSVLGRFLQPMRAKGVKLVGIDNIGLGKPIADRLEEMGWEVLRVNAGARAMDAERYYKVRTEMWDLMRIWLMDADIPDSDELHMDLTGPKVSYNSNQQLVLESKDSMEKRGLPSPDVGDATAISVVAPVLQDQAGVEVDFV